MKNTPLKIFFDGRCYVCAKEIDIYRRRNKGEVLEFIDISHPDFKSEDYGIDVVAVNREFHVINRAGHIFKGVDAFIQIWQVLPGWQWAAKIASIGAIKLVMKLGYVVFVWIRPYLPRRKQTCSEGVCFR